MSRTTKRELRYWIRKHLRGADTYINCSACHNNAADYRDGGAAERWCMRSAKNLTSWPYSTAPSWCPRRKANGGTE